jgi:hypothetical protein
MEDLYSLFSVVESTNGHNQSRQLLLGVEKGPASISSPKSLFVLVLSEPKSLNIDGFDIDELLDTIC